MAYLMLLGTGGWNERWEVAPGQEEAVSAQLHHVGTDTTGQLLLVDPVSERPIELFLAWQHVAAAAVIPSPPADTELRGQYA